MKSVFDPSRSTRSLISPFSPSMMEATAITVVTPITIPRMVRPERTLRARSVSSATERFSSTSWRVIRSPFAARSPGRDWPLFAPDKSRKRARSSN